MDCFDWLEGYKFNFGLYTVDRVTQKRTLKTGAQFFTQVIQAHNKVDKKTDKKITTPEVSSLTVATTKQDVGAGVEPLAQST